MTNPSNSASNRKAGKPIPESESAHVKSIHEQASGRSSGPRGAANGAPQRESKAMKHCKKK